jgi:uncharacterized protein (TIGR02444 family)
MSSPTTLRPDDLATPLWRYALALYRRPGVAPTCLALQSILGVDVCLLIYALYACHQQRALSAASLARVDDELQAWREQVVLPLRKIRMTMKAGVKGIASERSDWVREQIKATELNAEQVALAYLDTQIASLPQVLESPDRKITAIRKTVQCVLAHSAHRAGHLPVALEIPEVSLAIEVLTSEAHSLLHPGPDSVKPAG